MPPLHMQTRIPRPAIRPYDLRPPRQLEDLLVLQLTPSSRIAPATRYPRVDGVNKVSRTRPPVPVLARAPSFIGSLPGVTLRATARATRGPKTFFLGFVLKGLSDDPSNANVRNGSEEPPDQPVSRVSTPPWFMPPPAEEVFIPKATPQRSEARSAPWPKASLSLILERLAARSRCGNLAGLSASPFAALPSLSVSGYHPFTIAWSARTVTRPMKWRRRPACIK